LLIGGMGERSTLPLVAEYADEWNLTTASASVYLEKSEALADRCAQRGREPTTIARSVAVGVLVARDAQELRQRSCRMQAVFEPFADVATEAVADTARQYGWVVGTPQQVVSQLLELREAGVQRVILGHYLHDDDDALELIAAEIMPRLDSID
jgi:alkanesulfonate monooxygenase SsuD/methylene tetrahydromethanopterin reductase-like flavin-dependent oxidoreductase (luciferase family)